MDKKLDKEINFLIKHQELDKYNHNFSWAMIYSFVGVYISTGALLISLKVNPYISIISALLFFGILIVAILLAYLNQRDSNRHFIIREDMIRERLKKQKINTDKLTEEFREKYSAKGWKLKGENKKS